MSVKALGQALLNQYRFKKVFTGIGLWEFSFDRNGTILERILGPIKTSNPELFL